MKNIITDLLSPLAIILGGVFFTLYIRAFFLLHPRRFISTLRGEASFRALNLALAGTLGVGNIVGVVNAVRLGGEGAVFWMIVSAVLTSSLKYAEASLSVKTRMKGSDGFFGGAYVYIEGAFGRAGKLLGNVFAVLFAVNTLATGCIMQAKASAEALSHVLGAKATVCSALLAVAVLLSVRHGIRRISDLTNRIVPFACAVYIGLCALLIVLNGKNIIPVIIKIISCAFDKEGIIFGIGGFCFTRSMKCGIMRGLLSNEAGCGSSATAHATEENATSHTQGCMGIAEVLTDTVIMCGISAVALLSAGMDLSDEGDIASVISCFDRYGRIMTVTACCCIALFGFATVICFAGYGCECIGYTCAKHKKTVSTAYISIYVCAVALSVLCPSEAFLSVADLSMGLMSLINIPAMLLLRKKLDCGSALSV